MIIGLDILGHIPNLVLDQYGSGSCFKINDKLISVDNVNNFLSPEHMSKCQYNNNNNNNNNNSSSNNNNNNMLMLIISMITIIRAMVTVMMKMMKVAGIMMI